MVAFPDIGPEISEVRGLIAERRRDMAAKAAAKHLRSGHASPDFLRLVADLLDPPQAARRGRPSAPPKGWHEMGVLDDEMKMAGIAYERRIDALEKLGFGSTSTVQRGLRQFRDWEDELASIIRTDDKNRYQEIDDS